MAKIRRNITLDEDVHKRSMKELAKTGRTLSGFINVYLQKFLKRRGVKGGD